MTFDTIIAPATPPGVGGLAVIRISGPDAESVLTAAFSPRQAVDQYQSHKLYLGTIHDSDQQLLDEVMAVIMRAPHSFTREDVVEIHCHGGSAVVRSLLDRFLTLGLRMAKPGEFTQRAFLNGRLDLSQAEAVADLIHARSDAAARISLGQLQGKLAAHISSLRSELLEILALVEVHIDFSDQDIDLPDFAPLARRCHGLTGELQQLLCSFDRGRMLQEGVRILILGKPNVGKSSLLNALLGEARAIVTEIPGTTRDTVEEQLLLGQIPVRLIDTAGIRKTEDPVELEGVRRAKAKVASADLVLLVIDGSSPLDDDDQLVLSACNPDHLLLVSNKADRPALPLPDSWSKLAPLHVSAKTSAGFEQLQQAIIDYLFSEHGPGEEDLLIYERRHKQALELSMAALNRFVAAIEQGTEAEFLALELREAIHALGEISGETVTEAVLDQIFSKFCIGK